MVNNHRIPNEQDLAEVMSQQGNKTDHKGQQMKVVNELCAIPESEDFKQPVDHKALRLVDYPLIIRQPMDFNTIKKKVKEAKYKSNTQFINDINLIFDNCKKYNQDESIIFKNAQKLEKAAKKIFKKHLPNNYYSYSKKKVKRENESWNGLEINNDPNIQQEKIPLDEKVKLAQSIKQLNDQELFQVIKIIDQWSPSAIGDIQSDTFKIKIEDLSQLTIFKIYDYIEKINENDQQVQENQDVNTNKQQNNVVQNEKQIQINNITQNESKEGNNLEEDVVIQIENGIESNSKSQQEINYNNQEQTEENLQVNVQICIEEPEIFDIIQNEDDIKHSDL